MLANFLSTRWVPRAVALGTIGIILSMLNLDLEGDHFWALSSILALCVVVEFLAYQAGIATGMQIYYSLSPEQRAEIDRYINEQ